jgi:hypothetical protein
LLSRCTKSCVAFWAFWRLSIQRKLLLLNALSNFVPSETSKKIANYFRVGFASITGKLPARPCRPLPLHRATVRNIHAQYSDLVQSQFQITSDCNSSHCPVNSQYINVTFKK